MTEKQRSTNVLQKLGLLKMTRKISNLLSTAFSNCNGKYFGCCLECTVNSDSGSALQRVSVKFYFGEKSIAVNVYFDGKIYHIDFYIHQTQMYARKTIHWRKLNGTVMLWYDTSISLQ